MRSRWTILAAVAATCWVAPRLAAAEDVEEQLRRMSERMAQMEQQLEVTNQRLEATSEELESSKERVAQQQAVIQEIDAEREGSSALSKFLSETEFSGAVAASYSYNFNTLNDSAVGRNAYSTVTGENLGVLGLTAVSHQNSNNFQVDQLYFRMQKTPTPESRGGWGATVMYGPMADLIAGRSADVSCVATDADGDDVVQFSELSCSRDDDDVNGDLPFLWEAYASYLFDIGSGVTFLLGRYSTPLGGETPLVDQNFNVTRGLLWALQPVTHTGGYIAGKFGEDLSWQLGASNGYGNTMSDTDDEPTFVGSTAYTAETLGFRVTGIYGGDIDDLLAGLTTFGVVVPGSSGASMGAPGLPFGFNSGVERSKDKVALLDVVGTFNPTDQLSAWLNFDYYWVAKTGQGSASSPGGIYDLQDLNIWGIAAAGRYALTEATGFALRHEWLFLNDIGNFGADSRLISLTGTLDHALTDSLIIKAEARWDHGSIQDVPGAFWVGDVSGAAGSPPITVLPPGDFGGGNNQVLGLVQLMYVF
jgi:hypothetical protein